jgi:hypothetical protein
LITLSAHFVKARVKPCKLVDVVLINASYFIVVFFLGMKHCLISPIVKTKSKCRLEERNNWQLPVVEFGVVGHGGLNGVRYKSLYQRNFPSFREGETRIAVAHALLLFVGFGRPRRLAFWCPFTDLHYGAKLTRGLRIIASLLGIHLNN